MTVESSSFTSALSGQSYFWVSVCGIEEMEKFAEFVSSIGQTARSSPYMPPNAPVPRVTAAPNSPPANYVSCDLARQHSLSMSTQSQAGNVKILFHFLESY